MMNSTQDLASRIEALESRLAIDQLIAAYAHAFDSHDETQLRSIWHDGARLSLGPAFGEHIGVDAIVASARANWAQMPHMHHWMANTLVDLKGNTATGSVAVDCLCLHTELGPVQISGLYRDRYERRNGKWAFVERLFDLHFLTPLKHWQPIAGSQSPALA